jgi:hypothetical protein
MKSSRGWVGVAKVLSGVAAVLLLLVIVGPLVLGIPQNAAGMAAKSICSAALVAGRPSTTLLADDVLPASQVLTQVLFGRSARAPRSWKPIPPATGSARPTCGRAAQARASCIPSPLGSSSSITSMRAAPSRLTISRTSASAVNWPSR